MKSFITKEQWGLNEPQWIVWKTLPVGDNDNPFPVPMHRKVAIFKKKYRPNK